MSERYDHKEIEKAAQKKWAELNLYAANLAETGKDPYYLLVEFPYPSGDLHIGHWYAFSITDIYARMLRARGKNVLFPIGFDAFGLPAENAAIKNNLDPKEWTYKNMERMREQLASMGASFDWSKEIITCEPSYYHWTQWLFIKLFEQKLAEHREAAVKWCPKDQTVLANEQVQDGCCERCGTPVEEKLLTQWFLKITDYADRLLKGLDALPWREEIKEAQRAWIGKSEGAYLSFPIKSGVKKFVLLHGYKGNPEEDTYVWIRKTLEQYGYEVVVPALPNPENPTEEEWVATALNATTYDENTAIIGHSLGGVTAIKVAEKVPTKIAGVLAFGAFGNPEFVDKQRPFSDTFDWRFDADKIRKNTGWIKLLHDETDTIVSTKQAQLLADALGMPLTIVKANEPHFNGSEEPSVIRDFTQSIKVFTTRPETVYGATYVVLAPEHPLVESLSEVISNKKEVQKYVSATKKKTERERSENKEKTGVKLEGVMALNPATKEEIPVFVADYVLGSYGTGAVMAVPAHDERDFEFAKAMNLPVKQVLMPRLPDVTNPHQPGKEIISRRVTISIVHDPKTDRYLALKWKTQPWTTFITGGVEDGENIIESAKREVAEETGYTDIRLVRKLGGDTQSEFYAAHKGVNRIARDTSILFELVSDARDTVAEEEAAQHEAVWLTAREMETTRFQHSEADIIRARIRTGMDAHTGTGILIDSGDFSGKDGEEAKWDIVQSVGGERATQYRLRDWLISRQRYWGCPIPIVYDPQGKPHAVPAEHLPWLLPTDVDFKPTGKAPLASSKELKERVTRIFGEGWTPEYDTLDTFIDSSWYFLRYLSPDNSVSFSDPARMKSWLPVKRYSGGSEHTTMHLLYARFFMKALYDLALVPMDEPFTERFNRGLIMGPDGQKMSKSKGNVVNPDEFVRDYGADAVRLYLAFIGPYNEPRSYPWSLEGVSSMRKFLDRVVRLAEGAKAGDDLSDALNRAFAQAAAKISDDGDKFKFNTSVAALMILVNELEAQKSVSTGALKNLLVLLAPFAPHLAEHLWEKLSGEGSVHTQPWPAYDASLLAKTEREVVVQVSGKRRGSITISEDLSEEEAVAQAREIAAVATALGGKEPSRVVYVPGKILNLVP